jgi:tetratricopeptide (TPR) repeat protein
MITHRSRLVVVLLLLAPWPVQAQEPGLEDRRRYQACVELAKTDPARAETEAIAFQGAGGGVPARHCRALAQLAAGKPAAAAATLADAARAAEASRSPFAAELWAQAGNAAFLAGDDAEARAHLTAAIATAGEHAPQMLAAFHIDRARVAAEAGDFALARQDLDQAIRLSPDDPAAWMLSAALARRQGDLGRAAADMERATARAGDDPDVLFEAGNVAAAGGDMANARTLWQMAQRAGPGSEAARLAGEALKQAGLADRP